MMNYLNIDHYSNVIILYDFIKKLYYVIKKYKFKQFIYMNKQSEQTQLFLSLNSQIDQIMELINKKKKSSRTTSKLTKILQIINCTKLNNKNKQKLLQKIEIIRNHVSPAKIQIPRQKTKRLNSESGSKKNIQMKTLKDQDDNISFNNDITDRIKKEIKDDEYLSSPKNKKYIKQLEIKNEMQSEQITILKSRLQKARKQQPSLEQELKFNDKNEKNSQQLEQLKKKNKLLNEKLNEMIESSSNKDRKIEELYYNNQKLHKLIKLKDNELKNNQTAYQNQRKGLLERISKLSKYQLQMQAFEIKKRQYAGDDSQLKQIIKKYKTFLK